MGKRMMGWAASMFIGLLTGGLGLFIAGCVANWCVSWYRISSFEGGSGYFVVLIALMGGVAGGFIGLVTSWFLGQGTAAGFFKGLGLSWGIVLVLGGMASALAFLLADIPPRIDGQDLELQVEIRLPVGETNAPANQKGTASFTLASLVNHTQRKSQKGELKVGEARREEGRWIIPASAPLFTMRGKRGISAELGGTNLAGFIIPLPARPDKRFEQWSEWGPRPVNGTWPDSRASYRFRIQRLVPPPPPRDPALVEAEQFANLKPASSLEEWLPFLKYDAPEERTAAVRKVVESRQAELAQVIQSTNVNLRELALGAAAQLTQIAPEVSEAVRGEGREIAAALRRFNEMNKEAPGFYDAQIELRTRFNYWKQAWWTVQRKLGLDGRPPVKEIYELALVRSKDTTMDEIVINARVILDALEPRSTEGH